MTKTFFHSILSIFFSSMEVLGRQNIPTHGPVIFTGNHMNQFVDGAVIVATNPRRVGFLVAEKSMQKPLIGDFARACGSIPVARPQDKAKQGPGKIYFDNLRIVGEGTMFTKLVKGDKIRPAKSADVYRIATVLSDTEGILAEDMGDGAPLKEHCQGEGNWCTYEIMGHVDQSGMFSKVHAALANGQCIGIFPEGGSHDNTDLLPLKAGVAAIALGTQEKYDVKVPIVPVGLTYFRGHRFRGRLVVEFGEPIYITREISAKYEESKKLAYHALLQQVENGMRSVIVTAHDYNDLKMVHTVRRLYQRSSTSMSTKQKQDLARRWSEAYKMLKERYKDTGMPEEITALIDKIRAYQDALDKWGLRDYQLQHTHLQLSYSKMLYIFLHGLVILSLASIPSLILNFPVGIAANYWAYREAKKDLKASRVKLAARDVLLSKKILFSLAAVPILWVSYALIAFLFTSLETRTIIVLFLCCPVFSYIGVMAVEASIVDLKDLRPAFLRLLPKQQAEALPAQRIAIHKELRALVKKYGPSFGPLYYDKTDAWEVSHFGLPPPASPEETVAKQSKELQPPTNADQIASSIATTFCDEDETVLEKQKKEN
eukprot:CAMPEP_0170363748 /NCGR_PEP_ID=MMETSP0117_2-20130122/5017_1 /TAXON_ID=400756 /ORGANISM="Durinskia baltica, Strain CSIRO CS-38" /LENGTH=599 /DNA_ID=CAMNT_0010618225 /DNA_START=255 /DNA_END=2054 /DNA_ORIENTATION=+